MASLTLDPSHTGGLNISHPDNFLDITIPVNNNGGFPIMWQTMMVVPDNEIINFIPESPEVIIQGSIILTPTQIGLVQNQNGENIWKITAFSREPKTQIVQETLEEDKLLISGDATWQVLTPIVDGLSVFLSDTEHDEFILLNGSLDKDLAIKRFDGSLLLTLTTTAKFAWVKRSDTEWKIIFLQGFTS